MTNNKTKGFMFIITIVLSLYLSGCSLANFSASGKETPITNVNVYQGTEGLEIEFLTNSPPEKVYEGENFVVSTLLNNKGAYPITSGKVVLTHEPDYFDVPTTSSTFNLLGKTMYDPSEHNIQKSFNLNTKKLEPKSTGHDSIVLVTACYDYGTKLNTEVCIDTDPQNIKAIEKSCNTEDLSFSGQGAPIAITKIETKMIIGEGGKVRPNFWIYVQNHGDGQVISKSSIDKACGSASIDKNELNGVVLKDLKFSQYTLADMDCRPKPETSLNPVLKLTDNEQYFICTLRDDVSIPADTSTFKTGLYIELEYGYTLTKSKEFTIKKYNT